MKKILIAGDKTLAIFIFMRYTISNGGGKWF
jgi:hypothetical protein